MRAENAGAKTWLLGATAAWALCAWLLALLGMGGRVVPLPEDPSLLQPLPQARKAPPARLGPLAQYAEISRRPLFSEDRRPQPFVINPDGEDDGKGGFDYVLTSVLVAPGFRMAILQPSGGGESVRVREGAAPDTAPGWVLSSVDARSAVFNGPEGERKLELRVFDGEGGEPPTPMATDARSGAAAGPGAPATREATDARQTPRQATRDAAAPQPPAPSQPAAPQAQQDADANRPSAEQIEAIRRRIEERRRKLRQERPQDQPPAGQKP
ncbi:MAG TPA: hypothetical protein VM619_08465 [Luteimonas sp.]|nr:hypothetical protein [Luteimonas sp.]